ncbi:hypothetical protein LTR70_009084 [Exophiala xenobiotica]|uniref:Uncharacterized protein n=1 Tax=Lithohypha guttulata TaxID=1690604 RepID=A0ABR0JWR8_9EURO|nr:hypothetical protein LTR24_010029 [Lithohypha guttulata]KAK5311004.1 hypothetical protein LTR70_009084 [Exophiala xenobiotica]
MKEKAEGNARVAEQNPEFAERLLEALRERASERCQSCNNGRLQDQKQISFQLGEQFSNGIRTRIVLLTNYALQNTVPYRTHNSSAGVRMAFAKKDIWEKVKKAEASREDLPWTSRQISGRQAAEVDLVRANQALREKKGQLRESEDGIRQMEGIGDLDLFEQT